MIRTTTTKTYDKDGNLVETTVVEESTAGEGIDWWHPIGSPYPVPYPQYVPPLPQYLPPPVWCTTNTNS